MLMQSLRMTRRDWRAGELRFLLLALIVAVAAMSSVGFFVDRMRAGLNRDAHQLLGADVVVRADEALPQIFMAEAQRRRLQLAQTMVFPSMATAGEGERAISKLASIKAVSDAYPLRGQLKIGARVDAEGIATDATPAPGTLWVDPSLMNALNLAVGDTLKLGNKTFTIGKVLVFEPDRGAGFMSFAPRVMLAASDLPATGLVQFGSRIQYRLLVAGSPDDVDGYEQWAENKIQTDSLKGIRTETLESGRLGMRATLQRAEEFLSLGGLLSAMLAAVAVAMAARRFMLRHVDACAMLRCLGLTQRQLTMLYLIEFLLVGLIGSAIGIAIGFAAHFVLIKWLGALMSTGLPAASLTPALQGMATGLLLLLGFAVPPILQLRDVPHNRVLRREADAPQALTVATYVLGLLTFVGLLLWQAGNVRLGLLTAGGFIVGLALFSVLAWLFLKLLRNLRGTISHSGWRFAITALQRRPGATIVQIVALALGLMALLLLTVIRGDLVTAWRTATPPDAPNRFVINIQPDQKTAIATRLKQHGITGADLYPMIRGRLLAINDKPITGDSFVDGSAQRLVNREFNLSTTADIPPQNKIVAGHWYKNTNDSTKAEASVEEGLAKTLNLHLGDMLTFDIAGEKIRVPITSLRKLDWGSMRVNFFVIINPAAMQNMPQTWITAFHLPHTDTTFDNRLSNDFPNLTVVDVGSVLRQIQDMIEQVVKAVEFLFLFTLASGVLVLHAALVGSQDQRTREAGLLRALGATRRQLSRAQWIEFLLVGCLAGLLAAGGATAVGWSLAYFVFDFAWVFSPVVWLAGGIAGAVCAFIGGWFALRNVLNQPPLQTLREA